MYIYIPPSIHVESVGRPVKTYIEHEMKINPGDEQCGFEEYNSNDYNNIIDTFKSLRIVGFKK